MVNALLVTTLLAAAGPVGTASGGATCEGHTIKVTHAYASTGDCVGHPKVSPAGQFAVLLAAAEVPEEELQETVHKWHFIFVRGGQISLCAQDPYGFVEVHTGEGTVQLSGDEVMKSTMAAKKIVMKDGRVSGTIRIPGKCSVDVSFDAPLRAEKPAAK